MGNSILFEHIPVPIFYTPIECNNPVIVHRHRAKVNVSISPSSGRDEVVYRGFSQEFSRILEDTTKSFLAILREFIGGEYFSIKVDVYKPVYGIGLYALTTTLLLKDLGFGDEEVIESCKDVDEQVIRDPVKLMLLRALRASIVVGSSLIYREGEEPVKLNIDRAFSIKGYTRLGEGVSVKELLDEHHFKAAVIHLGGHTAIALARCYIAGLDCSKLLTESLIVLNGLQYMVKGVPPPSAGVLLDDLHDFMSLLVLEDDVSERDYDAEA